VFLLFVLLCGNAYLYVCVCVFPAGVSRQNLSYQKEITHREKGRDTLLEVIDTHTHTHTLTHTHFHPLSVSRSGPLFLTARLTCSYPSPSLYICLHADLSALYLSQAVHQPAPSPPRHRRGNRYGRTPALSSLHTPTGLCQQVTIRSITVCVCVMF